MSLSKRNPRPGETVAWLTGASSGIGLALAKQLASQYDVLIVSARSVDALNALAEPIANIYVVPFDVTKEADVDEVRHLIEEYSDRLNAVYMNAGTCEYFDIHDPQWEMAKRVMDVNFLGTIHTLAVAMPLLDRQAQIYELNNKQYTTEKPHIVGIGSLASMVPFSKAQFYGASKAALSYLLASLRMDLHEKSIDVSTVMPGFVKTPLTDKNTFSMPFIMTAEEAATRIVEGLRSRPFTLAFPKRLYIILRFWSFFPKIWQRYMSPKTNSTPNMPSKSDHDLHTPNEKKSLDK